MDDEGSLSKTQLYVIAGLCCFVLAMGLSTIFSPKEAEVESVNRETNYADERVLTRTERAQALNSRAEGAARPWWEWSLERILIDLDI